MKGDEIKFKPEVVKDYFYLKNEKIVILDNKAFKGVDPDILILGKIVENGDDEFIEPLSSEEYDLAIKKYEMLIKMLEEESENG